MISVKMLIISCGVLCDLIYCMPLNGINNNNNQRTIGLRKQRKQQIILFSDDNIETYAVPGRARNTRHSQVIFPDETITVDRDEIIREIRSRKNKWNDTLPFITQSESLLQCISSGKTFCNDYPSDYSSEYVDRTVRREIKSYSNFFKYQYLSTSSESSDLTKDQKKSSIEEKFPSCASKRTTIFPRYARDIDGEWNPVINTKKYRQAVQFNTCISQSTRPEDSNGNKIINFGNLFKLVLPNDIKAECVQRYQTHVLLTITNGRIDKKIFKVPSHCEFEVSRLRFS